MRQVTSREEAMRLLQDHYALVWHQGAASPYGCAFWRESEGIPVSSAILYQMQDAGEIRLLQRAPGILTATWTGLRFECLRCHRVIPTTEEHHAVQGGAFDGELVCRECWEVGPR